MLRCLTFEIYELLYRTVGRTVSCTRTEYSVRYMQKLLVIAMSRPPIIPHQQYIPTQHTYVSSSLP